MDGENTEYKIPLGLCKQAVMKLESAMADIYEIKEDEDLDPEDKDAMESVAEIIGQCTAMIINMVSKEMGEEEFLNEDIEMDQIDHYPGDDGDILDQQIPE